MLGDTAGVEREEVGHGLVRYVDADRVDKDELRDSLPALAYGHLGGDPAAERRADDQHVGEVTLGEQVQVAGREVGNGGDGVGPGRPVPPRVRGQDGVHRLTEVLGDHGDGGGPAAAMQDEGGTAGAGLAECVLGGAH
jgi:hypothetical protein